MCFCELFTTDDTELQKPDYILMAKFSPEMRSSVIIVPCFDQNTAQESLNYQVTQKMVDVVFRSLLDVNICSQTLNLLSSLRDWTVNHQKFVVVLNLWESQIHCRLNCKIKLSSIKNLKT